MEKRYTATIEHGNLIKNHDTTVYSDAVEYTSRYAAGTRENMEDAKKAWRKKSGICYGYAFAVDIKEA